jgi:hypothetical protein
MELEAAKKMIMAVVDREIAADSPGCYALRQAVYTLCEAYPVTKDYEKLCTDLCNLLAEHGVPCPED